MTKYRYTAVVVLFLSLMFGSAIQTQAAGEANSEETQVREVVQNLLSSYTTGDSSLYLSAVIHPESLQQQENLKYLTKNEKTYQIDEVSKQDSLTYVVSVSGTENGVVFPSIPYAVKKIDEKWKVDNLGYTFVPVNSDLVFQASSLVAENNNYKVYKDDINYTQKPQKTLGMSTQAIGTMSIFGPYQINGSSPAIYMNGPYHVRTTVKNYQKFQNTSLIVSLTEHRAEGKRPERNIGGATSVGASPGYFSMMSLYGYYSFTVMQEAKDMIKPPFGESISGTFTVDNSKR